MLIRRKFQFDAAHMLSNYTGKCSNLHGHTYTGEVCISAKIDEQTGMVLDYNVIKEVIDIFDHALVFSGPAERGQPENELLLWAIKYNMKYAELGYKCTAENIAKLIAQMIAEKLNRKCSVQVWLHETPDSTAMWEEKV